MHVAAHAGCMDTMQGSASDGDFGRKSLVPPGTQTLLVLHLAFQSDALPTEPSLPAITD